MSVAFPSGYNLERSSTFTHDNNVKVDLMDDGEPRQREMGADAFVSIACEFKYLTLTEKDTLKSFLTTNRAATITWTIDSLDYSGVFVGGHRESMTGALYNLSFTYRAKEV